MLVPHKFYNWNQLFIFFLVFFLSLFSQYTVFAFLSHFHLHDIPHYHNREASFFLPPYHYLQSCCCFHYCGFIVHTQRCRFLPPKASRFAICRSTFHRFCTVRTFCNVLLNPHFFEINAAVFHILNIGDQTVCSCSIQCFYADSQYAGCLFPCNQFIHRLLRHPFGICPVFLSLLVPECNIQAESLQLHTVCWR